MACAARPAESNDRMKFRFFSLVYGERFVDIYERIAVRSLLQTANASAIRPGTVVSLYTDRASADRAGAIAGRLGELQITIIEPGNAGDTLQRALIAEIERCIAENAALIMLPPDTFWGDGSLGNLLAVANGQNLCIGAPHVRVNRDDFLASLPAGDIDNAELVRLSMANLHPTWRDANVSLNPRNTWWSGTLIRQLSPKLYAVHHRLPTIYLAHFTPDDLNFFRDQTKLGSWDHSWPGLLVQQQRQRILSSSDLFFAAELTPENENIPPLVDADPAMDDRYRGNFPHHAVNANSVSSWRSA